MERLSLNSVDRVLLDLEAWPTVNEHVFDDPVQRDIFERRCRAVRLFVAGVQGDRILSETGISSRMALYWFRRAMKIHPDGRIYGFRALLPCTHIAPYRRVAEVDRDYLSSPAGASGAFGKLLRTHPDLKELIDRHVLKLKPNVHIYEPRLRLKSLHKRFLDLCRKLNLDVGNQYPFNTITLAHRSLSAYVHKLFLENTEKAIPAIYGSDAARDTSFSDDSS